MHDVMIFVAAHPWWTLIYLAVLANTRLVRFKRSTHRDKRETHEERRR